MKTFLNIALVWVTLFLSQPIVAADASVEIMSSVQVHEILKNASPSRKKRLKEAIRAGNTLAVQFLDGTVFQDDENWQKRTGSLLGMSGVEFMRMAGEWGDIVRGGTTLVCPDVRLDELTEITKGGVSITYQSIRMGVLIGAGTQFDLPTPNIPYSEHYSPERKGESHRLQLNINAENKLVNVIPQDKLIPNSYKVHRSAMNLPNNRRPIYMGETSALVKERVASLDQAIKDMDQAASEVCKSTSSNTNTTKGQ